MDNVIIVQFPKYFNVMIEKIMLKDNIGLGDIFTLRIVLISGRHDTIKLT
jgi:hypothetical protein